MDKWPIFNESWWLNEVCISGEWGECIVKDHNQIIGRLPWYLKSKMGFQALTMPPLTQTLGPWILPPDEGLRDSEILSREREIMNDLIVQLPKSHYFEQNFSPNITDILPWYWRDFLINASCTYRLVNIKDHQNIYEGFQKNIRGDINKAKNNQIKIRSIDDIETLISINKKSFSRQNITYPYSEKILHSLDNLLVKNGARKILVAEDAVGRIHAGIYVVYSNHAAYNLLFGRDSSLPNYGAGSLLMSEAIKFASTVTDTFDFEGSMIFSIEKFFRGFGAIQTPILNVRKTSGLISELIVRKYRNFRKF